MKVRIFTLRFSKIMEGFDDENVRLFMSDKEIVSANEHFFEKDGLPYIALVLFYHSGPPALEVEKKTEARESRKSEYKSILDDQSMPAFNMLKEWRRERAKQMGSPPYVVFNNRELAMIAEKAPANLNELAQIRGVGSWKLEKFGDEVLGIVRKLAELKKAEPKKKGSSRICGERCLDGSQTILVWCVLASMEWRIRVTATRAGRPGYLYRSPQIRDEP